MLVLELCNKYILEYDFAKIFGCLKNIFFTVKLPPYNSFIFGVQVVVPAYILVSAFGIAHYGMSSPGMTY